MERTKFNSPKSPTFTKINIPDAINFSPDLEYTQIPNHLIRNPELSAKAKIVLFILLSNKKGWVSYKQTLLTFMKEGSTSLESALVELENNEFLVRIRYRMKSTKQWAGSFWGYTNQQGMFHLENQLNMLDELDLEPITGKPITGKPEANNINNKKTNFKKIKKGIFCKNFENFDSGEDINKKITFSDFTTFWQLYPRKSDRGGAEKEWRKICNRTPLRKPTLQTVLRAVQGHKDSEQWSTSPQFIPHARTWLYNERWKNEPAEMKAYNKPTTRHNTVGKITDPDYDYSDDLTM